MTDIEYREFLHPVEKVADHMYFVRVLVCLRAAQVILGVKRNSMRVQFGESRESKGIRPNFHIFTVDERFAGTYFKFWGWGTANHKKLGPYAAGELSPPKFDYDWVANQMKVVRSMAAV